MAIVFGIFHQAGLVPAIDLVQHQAIGFQVCQEAQPDLEHTVCMTDPLRQGESESTCSPYAPCCQVPMS